MEKVKNIPSQKGTQKVTSKSVGRMKAEIEKAAQQIEWHCFSERDKPRASEICLIIAEVALLPDGAEIQIAGEKLPLELVREVYARLTHEHALIVLRNFEKVHYEIKNKKTYMRTSLYNSVFEFEHYWENEMRAAFSPLQW